MNFKQTLNESGYLSKNILNERNISEIVKDWAWLAQNINDPDRFIKILQGVQDSLGIDYLPSMADKIEAVLKVALTSAKIDPNTEINKKIIGKIKDVVSAQNKTIKREYNKHVNTNPKTIKKLKNPDEVFLGGNKFRQNNAKKYGF